MALFRRKKTDTGMPAEVQDYYQAENRERSWVAWVLALVTLLVTIMVVLGLFFGGRYLYRKIRGQDKPATVSVETNTSQTQTTPAPASSGTTPSTNSSSTPSTPATGTSSTNTTRPSTTTQPTTTDLPATGPGDTVAVFLAVTVFAYIAHRRFLAN